MRKLTVSYLKNISAAGNHETLLLERMFLKGFLKSWCDFPHRELETLSNDWKLHRKPSGNRDTGMLLDPFKR